MIEIEMELTALFLALRLSKQVELCRLRGDDDFALFRAFAGIIRDYEMKRGEKGINEQNNKYNF